MVDHSCAADQEPACLLTQFFTMTATHKFPSLVALRIVLVVLEQELVRVVLDLEVDGVAHPVEDLQQGNFWKKRI